MRMRRSTKLLLMCGALWMFSIFAHINAQLPIGSARQITLSIDRGCVSFASLPL